MSDYSELKKLAEAATPGPWYEQDDEDSAAGAVFIMPKSESWAPPICRISVESDASFIAAANPSEVMDLIADREALDELAERRAQRIIELATELNAARDEIEALRKEVEKLKQKNLL